MTPDNKTVKDEFMEVSAAIKQWFENKRSWNFTEPDAMGKWANDLAEKVLAVVEHKLECKPARFYSPDEYPTRVEDEDFSVDVFILDENGMHGIAFWNFDDEVWRFHTDTLVDYNEKGAETKWKWYYPPFTKDFVFGSK